MSSFVNLTLYKLKEVVSESYQGNIDVVDITMILIKWRGVFVDYTADGKTVLLGGGNAANDRYKSRSGFRKSRQRSGRKF